MSNTYSTGYSSHTHSIDPSVAHTHSFTVAPPTAKETTAQKVASERREKREREKLEQRYEALDALGLDGVEPTTVVLFGVERRTKLYTYAALFVAEHWYLTGSALNGGSTEDFLALLVQWDVDPDGIEVRRG